MVTRIEPSTILRASSGLVGHLLTRQGPVGTSRARAVIEVRQAAVPTNNGRVGEERN